ncbi:putative mfs general substrate transporter protein [Botryosphaeria dothidea]|uniref:Mfs general substrate transporter protein n=1 Tax=Botryosphaeria dothidea TaxID=55169 RepID=A0A8H4IZM8_9PEZI|nr:putative mfs general substrate transporter protein [Botryosphaeria dothidea]
MDFLRAAFASSYGPNKPKFFFWYPSGTTSAEKKLLHKIDFFILSYACLGYFAKWLDQANLSNAYVSGMKEDLRMYGTEYNLATTCFQVGTILGGIPSNLLLTWVPPRYLLPGQEFIWLYPLRFFIGLLEGSSFVGIQYVLGSWYKRTEIGKRTAIFACSAYVGTMVSGYIQSGVQASLGGNLGIEPWRWVFIIDGIITVVIAMYGIAFFPDTPEKTTAFYFTEQEKERAVERLVEDDREPKGEFSWNIFVRVVQSWQFYALSILWCFWNTTVGKVGNTVMQLYLKNDTEHTWSVYQINNIPTAINGWNIVMILFLNVYVDATGNRMTAVMINIFSLILGTALLTAWPLPLGARILSYLLASLDGPLSPLYLAWANILCSSDKQVRALTLACMNSFGAAVTTLIQQFLYPVTDAPEYRKGFPVSLACVCAMSGYVFVVRGLELREERRKSVEGVDVEEGVEGVGVRAEKVG